MLAAIPITAHPAGPELSTALGAAQLPRAEAAEEGSLRTRARARVEKGEGAGGKGWLRGGSSCW